MPTINLVHISLEMWGIIFCVIEAFCVIIGKKAEKTAAKILFFLILGNIFLLFGDVLAWFFRGRSDFLSSVMVRVGTFSVYIMSNIMLAIFSDYLYNILTVSGAKANQAVFWLIKAISLTGVALVVLTQFFPVFYYYDKFNIYHRASLFFLDIILLWFGIGICGIVIVINRKKMDKLRFWVLLAYVVLPFCAAFTLIYFYGPIIGNLATTAAVMLIFAIHMYKRSQLLLTQQNEIYAQKAKLSEQKTAILLGIIKPHFINNCLSVVMSLYYEDPEGCINTMQHLSEYLRKSMLLLDREKKITFRKELELTEEYLYLEKKRFVGKIEIKENIAVDSFSVPAFTLQPIVENAVKHGIRGSNRKGIISISTHETENEYIVTVKDNGVGFEPKNIENDEKKHFGIATSREMIALMSNGRLEIESAKGRGTEVRIYFPKETPDEHEIK